MLKHNKRDSTKKRTWKEWTFQEPVFEKQLRIEKKRVEEIKIKCLQKEKECKISGIFIDWNGIAVDSQKKALIWVKAVKNIEIYG